MGLSPDERDAAERELARAMDRQRWHSEVTKILSVLLIGTDVAIGAAAWQQVGTTNLSLAGAILVCVAGLFALGTFAFDVRDTPDVDKIIAATQASGGNIPSSLFANLFLDVHSNEIALRRTKTACIVEIPVAVAAAVVLAVVLMTGTKT